MVEGRIYCITNLINNHKYIGQTIKPIKIRLLEHIKGAMNNGKYPIQRAIKKYGVNKFKIRTIILIIAGDKVSLKKLLNNSEKYYIKKYNTFYGSGYNASLGGDGGDAPGIHANMYGKKHSKETIKKMSLARLSTINPAKREDVRKKISLGVKKHNKIYGSSNLGRVMPDEQKMKIGRANKGANNGMFGKPGPWKGKYGKLAPNFGNKYSDETRKMISLHNLGKLKGELNPSKRLEVRRKISIALTGIKRSAEAKEHYRLGALNRPKILCPFCGLYFTKQIIKRHHEEKCKIRMENKGLLQGDYFNANN